MFSFSQEQLSSLLTGLSTGFVAVSSVIDDPLVRTILIGSGSLCATFSIYFQFEKDPEDEESSTETNIDDYMRGLREGVTLGKEIAESGGTIPPTFQSNREDSEREPEFDQE